MPSNNLPNPKQEKMSQEKQFDDMCRQYVNAIKPLIEKNPNDDLNTQWNKLKASQKDDFTEFKQNIENFHNYLTKNISLKDKLKDETFLYFNLLSAYEALAKEK